MSQKVIVLFEVKPKEEGREDYLARAATLKSHLEAQQGFVSAERFSSLSEPGKLLSLSVWENEAAAAAWRRQIDHRQSQRAGHDELFENYRITVASVLRQYSRAERSEAPEDSNNHLKLR